MSDLTRVIIFFGSYHHDLTPLLNRLREKHFPSPSWKPFVDMAPWGAGYDRLLGGQLYAGTFNHGTPEDFLEDLCTEVAAMGSYQLHSLQIFFSREYWTENDLRPFPKQYPILIACGGAPAKGRSTVCCGDTLRVPLGTRARDMDLSRIRKADGSPLDDYERPACPDCGAIFNMIDLEKREAVWREKSPEVVDG